MAPQQYAPQQQLALQPAPPQIDPATSAALMMQQQALQSQQQQQAMGAMTSMVMLQTMQQMQQQQMQQQQGGSSGGGGAPAAAKGPLQLDVSIEWSYCGSHTPVEEREWEDSKFRILVGADSTAESIAQEALGRADMGEYGIVEHNLKTEEGYAIKSTDPVALVRLRGALWQRTALPLRLARLTRARKLTSPPARTHTHTHLLSR
jgi:hypothetical protein